MKKLNYYGGAGLNNTKKKGVFEVRAYEKVYRFEKLSDAIKLYRELNCEKTIWDVTKIPVLLDAYFYR